MIDRTELAQVLDELGYIGTLDGEVEITPKWRDYTEGQRWLVAWGVFWRTTLAQVALVIILIIAAAS